MSRGDQVETNNINKIRRKSGYHHHQYFLLHALTFTQGRRRFDLAAPVSGAPCFTFTHLGDAWVALLRALRVAAGLEELRGRGGGAPRARAIRGRGSGGLRRRVGSRALNSLSLFFFSLFSKDTFFKTFRRERGSVDTGVGF